MTEIEIYEQTQGLAQIVLAGQGYELNESSDKSVINHLSRNPRVANAFATAVEIQEFLHQHEMADVIDEYEQHLIDTFHKDAWLIDSERSMFSLHLEGLIMNKAFDDIKAMKAKHKFN